MKRTEKALFNEEERKMISEHILKGAPEFEIERFIITCERTGLDPFSRQIYGRVQSMKIKNRGGGEEWVKVVVIMTSIDGLRAIAERSGQYQGQTHPEWMGKDSQGWEQVWLGRDPQTPEAARVGVYRENFKEPVFGVARYMSYVQWAKKDDDPASSDRGLKPNPFWRKMPDVMLSKCAEALAMRKAFPLLLSGLYIDEEIRDLDDDEPTPQQQQPEEPPLTYVPGHSPEERAAASKKAAQDAAGGTSAPAAPVEPPQAPAAPPAEEKPAAEPPAAAPKGKGKAKKEPEAPVAPATPQGKPNPPASSTGGVDWANYVISQITIGKFAGKKLAELTPADIASLEVGWVQKYAEKIKLNPDKIKEAAMISAAHKAHEAAKK